MEDFITPWSDQSAFGRHLHSYGFLFLLRFLMISIFRSPDLPLIKKIIFGFISLLKGMRVTFRYLINPSTVVTQQYPENRETLKLADRVRAQLEMIHDEKGYHKCTSCHICEEACPNASIRVIDRKTPSVSKTELDHFIWRLDSCTFCNLCVMVCPFSCLKMNSHFESSVFDQRLLVYNLNKYAGPTSTALAKLADDETRSKMMVPRTPYEGPVALDGGFYAGIPRELLPPPIDSQLNVQINPQVDSQINKDNKDTTEKSTP
jgi:NADH-quinone oxidoreductase subunit I